MPVTPIEIAAKVFSKVDAMLGYWDRDLKCRFANAAFDVWFGKTRQEMAGISMQHLLGPMFEANLPYVRGVLGGQPQEFERTLQLPDGTIRHSLVCYFPDFAEGEVIGFIVQVTDVSRLKRLELDLQEAKKRAEELATHDFLTGLPNRVLLMDRIGVAIARVQRGGGQFAVCAIDLDWFKLVNDTYGHSAGDAVLKEIALRIKCATRATDTITRLGGDEFIFLANEIGTEQDLIAGMRRLMAAVCRPLHLEATTILPTLSCGIALYPRDASSAEMLMRRADEALYEAKRLGKNRFVFAGQPNEAGSASPDQEEVYSA